MTSIHHKSSRNKMFTYKDYLGNYNTCSVEKCDRYFKIFEYCSVLYDVLQGVILYLLKNGSYQQGFRSSIIVHKKSLVILIFPLSTHDNVNCNHVKESDFKDCLILDPDWKFRNVILIFHIYSY